MTLSDWMLREGLSDNDFAKRLNALRRADGAPESGDVNYRTVQKWRTGIRTPRRNNFELIFRATDGEVDANSFVPGIKAEAAR